MSVLAFLGAAHFLDHFYLLIFPTAVLFIHREWGMGYDEALALGTAAFAAFALGTLPSGWLGDKWGGVRMMRLYFPALGLASIATGFAQGPLGLAAGLALIGLGASIYHPVANALIIRLAVRRGRALAANGVCGNFGVAGAALVTGLLASQFGWRMAFIVPGAVTLAIGLLFLWYARGEDFEAGLLASADALQEESRDEAEDAADRPSEAGAGEIGADEAGAGERRGIPAGLVRVFIAIAAIALFGGLLFNGVTVAAPQLMVERLAGFDLSLGDIGVVTAMVFAVAGFAQLPVGYLLDRIGPRRILLFLAGCEVPLLLLIGFGPPILTPFATAVLVMLMFGEVPISAWLIGHYVSVGWRSRVYAMQTLLSLGVGAAVVPLLALGHGLTGNMAFVIALMAPAAAAVFAATFLLPRSDGREKTPALSAAGA